VRPARAQSCGCKSCRKWVTTSEVKRHPMRASGLVALAKVADATVSHIWTYDLTRRKAQLTYKAP